MSGKVVSLHLDSITAKDYLFDHWCSISFSRLACHILNLVDKPSITPILAYIPAHFNVKADYQGEG